MAKKKNTGAAEPETMTEASAAAEAMTQPAALTGSGVASTETTTTAAPSRVKVRFVKRCEVSALRVTCAPGATMTLTAELANKLETAGFARIVGI